MVVEAVRATRPRWYDEPEAHGVTIEVVTNLGEVPRVRATAAGLHGVLVNLLLNASAAMPEGGTITLVTRPTATGVQVTCQDTGVGMSEEISRRVFEPFFTTRRDVGSGLGLSTARAEIAGWGGTIEVVSAPGVGTTFILLLPIWTCEPPAPPPAVIAMSRARRGRLLVVDDDEITRTLLSEVLSAHHEVEAVPDGPTALARLKACPYDVVLIDLGIPGMPGDRLRQEIERVCPSAATILVTGWLLEGNDPRRVGFDLVLSKPFNDLGSVREAVAQAMSLRDSRGGTVD